MPQIVTPAEMKAVTAPYLELILPGDTPLLSRDALEVQRLRGVVEEMETTVATLRKEKGNLRADVSMALDGIRELVTCAQHVLQQLEATS